MDVALYVAAAALLIVLIAFVLKIRRKTEEGEHKLTMLTGYYFSCLRSSCFNAN